MKHFYIIPNRSKDVNLEIANEIKREFESKSEEVSVVICDSAQYGKELHRCIPADTECILVLGGDGTLLQTAWDSPFGNQFRNAGVSGRGRTCRNSHRGRAVDC